MIGIFIKIFMGGVTAIMIATIIKVCVELSISVDEEKSGEDNGY